jgi:hypothetical protein
MVHCPFQVVWVQKILFLIYQSGSGPGVLRKYLDGTEKFIGRHQGVSGVVCIAKVTDRPQEREDSEPESYSNGTVKWWRYYAPTEALSTAGFVARPEVAKSLGHLEAYTFRGFGDNHSGLKRITKEQFETIFSAFVNSYQANDEKTKRKNLDIVQNPCPSGEGEPHRTLKEKIAADPVKTLGEVGLKFWGVEWPFASEIESMSS